MGRKGREAHETEGRQPGVFFCGDVCVQYGSQFCAPGYAHNHSGPAAERLYVRPGTGGHDGLQFPVFPLLGQNGGHSFQQNRDAHLRVRLCPGSGAVRPGADGNPVSSGSHVCRHFHRWLLCGVSHLHGELLPGRKTGAQPGRQCHGKFRVRFLRLFCGRAGWRNQCVLFRMASGGHAGLYVGAAVYWLPG